MEEHGLTRGDRDARLVGGFTFVAGSGDGPRRDTVCSIAGLEDGVLVVLEVGAKGRSLLRYDDLLGLEVGGHGLISTGRRYVGGGRGVTGALAGMAVASMLTNASQKFEIDSFIRITSRETEMVLSHSKYPPEAVRNMLSMMFIRYQRATRPQPSRRPVRRTHPVRSTSWSG